MKKIIPILALAVIGVVVAREYLPGFKSKLDKATAAFVGWTEDARKSDPVGYIEYAEKQLKENIDRFEEAQVEIATAKKNAEESLDGYRDDHAYAVQFSEDAREKYKAAEAAADGDGYPVELLGDQYDHDQLIEQVQLILAERDLYADMTTQFEGLIANLDERADSLRTKVKTTEFELKVLEGQKALVATQKITDDVEAILAKVNEVIANNATTIETIETIDDPVRSIDDLKRELEGKKEGEAKATSSEVMAFLET